MSKSTEETIDGIAVSKDSVVITDDAVYNIEMLGDIADFTQEDAEKEDVVFIDDGFYYIYRGVLKHRDASNPKPGIYQQKDSDGNVVGYYLVEPETDEEKAEYDFSTHVATLNPVSIIDTANTKEEILIAIPESTKIFQPVLSENDDILKRVAKMALLAKNVDLDRYKDRFTNKNELFNFKQVIRGDNKLSILIFNRGCEALNLKYSIVLEERNPNDVVGDPLKEPIVVSSEDTYEM